MTDKETRQFPQAKPRFFYGYVVVLSGFIILTMTFGINFSFGVFFKPLLADFGWARAVISAAYSILTLVAGLWGIFAGGISDKVGPRIVAVAGGVCLGLGFLLMSRVNALWQLYLFHGLIIAPGIGGSWPVVLATVTKWFVARRGLMTGIVVGGIGFGTILTPPIASWLISIYDWRSAYAIVGIGTMVLTVAAALLLKGDPQQMGLLPYGAEQRPSVTRTRESDFLQALRTRQFWMVCGIYFFFGYCMHTVMVHIVPHAIGIGLSPASAASILAIMGGTSIFVRFIVGAASDRFGTRSTLVVALLILLVTLIWLQSTGSLWGLVLFGVFFGMANGGPMTLQPLLLAELFGLGSLGVIVGGASFIYTIGSAIGPVVAGYIFDVTESYHLAFLICAVFALVAIILTLLMKPVETGKEAPGTY